ncbi:hypothetical protein [Sporosarcina sp. FSL K6-1508]|uniref:hypothetical protein n=1 Tax=Sporosarcina sp. FSL K6-1508 TaxID=2921553 RepID=UPI0030FC17F3
MLNKVREIEVQKNNIGLLKISMNTKGNIQLENRPSKRSSGLYWLYTSYSIDELCKSIKSTQEGAVKVAQLANNRKSLRNVIKKESGEEFWVVYNGIGGCKETSKHSYDLGSRIVQEFSNHKKTGSLKVMGTNLNDLTKWRYSYVELDGDDYQINSKSYETCWRLEFGWPILSNK